MFTAPPSKLSEPLGTTESRSSVAETVFRPPPQAAAPAASTIPPYWACQLFPFMRDKIIEPLNALPAEPTRTMNPAELVTSAPPYRAALM